MSSSNHKNEIIQSAENGLLADNEWTVEEYIEYLDNELDSADFAKYYGRADKESAFKELRERRAEFESWTTEFQHVVKIDGAEATRFGSETDAETWAANQRKWHPNQTITVEFESLQAENAAGQASNA